MTPRVVLVRIGPEWAALPLDGVWHVLQAPQVFGLLSIRPGFRGVFVYQDELLPLLDLPALLDIASEEPWWLVLVYGSDAGPLGLPVHQVLKIVERRHGVVEPRNADGEPGGKAQDSFVYNGKAYPLLDIEALLSTLSR